MKQEDLKIGIITFPVTREGKAPLTNLVDIFRCISDDVYLITGNVGYVLYKEDKEIHTYGVSHKEGTNIFTRVLNFINTQLGLSYMLAKVTKNVDLWFFFLGGEGLPLPMLVSKLLRKQVVLVLTGFPVRCYETAKRTLTTPLKILVNLSVIISDRIVVYSGNIVEERGLGKYQRKVAVAHRHFLNFDLFQMKKKLKEREDLIGYIGGLHEWKGVLDFVEAIPIVLSLRRGIRFLVGGDGPLLDGIGKRVRELGIENEVKVVGWIPHDEIPHYLNDLRLLVLPSYTEGLPNIMLEAMACGTPVLATPIGAIPDVIKEGENGFQLRSNEPEDIAETIVELSGRPELLEKVSINAYDYVRESFCYEKTLETWRGFISQLGYCSPWE